MKTLLACAGVNGDEKALAKLVKAIEEKKPDGILFAGGITAPDTKGPKRAKFIGKFFEALGKCSCFAAIIPGPHDVPLHEFLRIALNMEIVYPNISVVHATPVSKDDVVISGLGGEITEDDDICTPVVKVSHAAVEYYLRTLWRTDKSTKILMLSEPPPGVLAGYGGNPIVREVVNTYHPDFLIVAGQKVHRGTEGDKHGTVINPGLMTEGSAAWIELLSRKVKMLDL